MTQNVTQSAKNTKVVAVNGSRTISSVTKAGRVVFSTISHLVGRVTFSPNVVSLIPSPQLDTSRFRFNQNPVETPDGATTVFTLPNSESFKSGLIEVFINGNQKVKDTEWQETGTTQFTLLGSFATSPPTSDEVISMNYIIP